MSKKLGLFLGAAVAQPEEEYPDEGGEAEDAAYDAAYDGAGGGFFWLAGGGGGCGCCGDGP